MRNLTLTILFALFALLLRPAPARAGSPASGPGPAPEGELIGLYPLALPAGQEALQQRLAAQLHDGAGGLAGVRAFDLIPRGSCLPDEGGCLAAAARSARLSEIVSAQVEQKAKGYAFTLRLFDARDGKEKNTHRGEVQGGPLDLAGGLEHGVCSLLGGAPCTGTLAVRGEAGGCKVGAFAPKLFVDGVEQGELPLQKPLTLTVGRHEVRAGSGEGRKIRTSYGRQTRLLCEVRAGMPELAEDLVDVGPRAVASGPAPGAAPLAALQPKPAPALTPRQAGGRLAIAAGIALLVVSSGVGLWAHAQGAALDDRYRAGALTDADKPAYGQVHAAGAVSLAAVIAGGAAILGGSAALLFAPTADALPQTKVTP